MLKSYAYNTLFIFEFVHSILLEKADNIQANAYDRERVRFYP